MKLPMDIATRVSRHLSKLIDKIVNDTNREQPPTLANVRTAVLNHMTAGRRPDSMHPQQSASMLEEVEGLIDEFGGDALAIDFVAAKASEGLSRIIEVAMDNPIVRHEPTLGGVRDAMAAGLTARLVGDGIIDPDEDQTLLAEIDGLIERHGRDAVAEDFVRFE